MKSIKFKSTKNNSLVEITIGTGYKKTKLPFFKKWTEALESGKFRQTRGRMRASGNKCVKYCCLGVLSKIQGRLSDKVDVGTLDLDNPCSTVFSDNGQFPSEVSVWVDGLNASSLVALNDDFDLSFKDISKVIKTIWKK